MNTCCYCKRVLPTYVLVGTVTPDHVAYRCRDTDNCREAMQAELRKKDP